MHLIPTSWSHLHMLVSVFPSVGLIFAIGFYVTSLVTNNETMKRLCLFVFGLLGLLSIPTYYSGNGSAEAIAKDPKINPDIVFFHAGWGNWALALLAILGLTALYKLWRAQGTPRLSDNATHLVLGLSLVTLALMAICGEIGWEIAHHELQLSVASVITVTALGGGAGTPQLWSHVHIIVNHFPTVGFVFALGFYVVSLLLDNIVMKRAALVVFVICAIMGIPTYVTGAAAMWALTDPPIPGIAKAAINAHRDWALMSLFGLAFTGGLAWIEVWRFRHLGRFSKTSLTLVLLFGIATLGIMAETGHRGGQINHPEIREAETYNALPANPDYYWSPRIETEINNVIWFVPWQTVHFFGYSMVFGTVLAVVLRVLGFWKSMPFSAVHRLLPLGVFGVMMNIFTGMLMLMADTFRYVNEITFVPKMIFLPIGAMAVLYFSLSEKLWTVKAGEDAPMAAKWVACLILASWAIVIMGGRLLPYV